LVRTILPPYTIIFPGSFNPIHKGHVALARAAIKVMIKKRNKELIDWYDSQGLQTPLSSSKTRSNDIWNTIEHQQYVKKKISSLIEEEKEEDIPLLFEISLMNADKPPIELSQVQQRISFFQDYVATFSQQKNKFNNTNDNIPMPKDWGVVLTNAPLFIEKVKLFKQYMTSSSFSSYPSGRLTFLIGVDTMIRIINPKYYNQSNDEMLKTLYNMQSQGVHFVVGGRLDQKKGTNDTSSETATMPFMTGKEELNALPHDLKGIFTLIAEDDFRVDISSTELRSRTKN
jgi:nicotinic acid mononucleotide adenylyltransferase